MAVPDVDVAVTDAGRLDPQQHLLALGLGIGIVAQLERLAPFDDLHRTHAGIPPASAGACRSSEYCGTRRRLSRQIDDRVTNQRRGHPDGLPASGPYARV